MSRRRREDEGIDLFAFQDIVTGTTGILIVITLLMALTIGSNRIEQTLKERQADVEVSQQQKKLQARQQALVIERDKRLSLQQAIEALQSNVAEYLQAEVEALRASKLPDPNQDKQRRLIPPTSASLRKPLTVVAVEDHFELLDDDGNLLKELSFSLGTTRLQKTLQSELGHEKDGFLFLIKPSAFRYNDNIVYLGIRDGRLLFPYSYDIIPEDWQVSLR
jgi:hypothetical protein